MSNLTDEQRSAIKHIMQKLRIGGMDEYTAIKAVAGSGKSSTLLALAKIYDQSCEAFNYSGDIIYMVFNKSMQKEAAEKGFPSRTFISTIHSFAYKYIVPFYEFEVEQFIRSKSITRVRGFQNIVIICENLENFFISKHLTFDDYLDEIEHRDPIYGRGLIDECKTIMKEMLAGDRKATHGFYLKMFHKLIVKHDGIIGAWTKNPQPIPSMILFDEAQDAAPVALEIFKALKAKHKVFVGDNLQNIYGFMKTVSIFDEIKEATEFPLTKSFRVKKKIAKGVQTFCNEFINKDIKFSGIDMDKRDSESIAYISRTNSALMEKAIELTDAGIKFNMTKDISDKFELPLAILKVSTPSYRMPQGYEFLRQEYKDFTRSLKPGSKKTFTSYVKDAHEDDPEIKNACRAIRLAGPAKLLRIKDILHGRKLDIGARVTLTTAHSSKGLEFDEVFIMDEVNKSVIDIIEEAMDDYDNYSFEKLPKDQKGELYLYYVVCTRAKLKLHNAKFIKQDKKKK